MSVTRLKTGEPAAPSTPAAPAARVQLEPPKDWGMSDEELASAPLAYRPDLLADQVWLVSGGGSGMGRALAFVLTRLGARVVICGRSEEKLRAVAAGVQQHCGRAIDTQAMNIRDPAQVEALFEGIVARHGRIDCVVNSAGGQFPQSALEYSVKGWNAVIDTNLNGTWYMMQAVARRWAAEAPVETVPPVKHRGSIVNIVAVISRGNPQVAHTSAARAGVIALTKSVSTEWAQLGIRVNCLAPGSIATEGLNVYPRAAAEAFRDSNPMRRLGDVMDIAHAVIYLGAQDTGKFVTGELLVVDGGRQQWGDDWPAGIPEWFKVETR